MSVPGLEGQQQVELTSWVGGAESGGAALFHPEQGFLSTEKDLAASRESPHLRWAYTIIVLLVLVVRTFY